MSAWRVGPGGVVYEQAGDELTMADKAVGVMVTPELAQMAAQMHNEYIDALRTLIGLLHRDALPEDWWADAPGPYPELHLSDVVERLSELLEPYTVGAPATTAEATDGH